MSENHSKYVAIPCAYGEASLPKTNRKGSFGKVAITFDIDADVVFPRMALILLGLQS